MKSMRILVFGTFDGLHPGHIFFLQSARALGTHLTVCVSRDAHVFELKGTSPKHTQQERLTLVKGFEGVDEAMLSDQVLGSFSVVSNLKPDRIVLGHDQDKLEKALNEWMDRTGVNIQLTRIGKRHYASNLGGN